MATILGATTKAPEQLARGYSIDSRTVATGQLFFAIRGPRFDGHDFVLQALERGAVGAVIEHGYLNRYAAEISGRLLPVSNTTEALQRLARGVRQKWGKPLVAVTGSTGKSTTKEMTAAILSERFSVLKSQGNLNNYYGLPLTLLALQVTHGMAVVELAMSAPGEIALLTRIAEPQVGIVTNVAPVHLQFFDSIDSISRAKRELVENLPSSATAVLNFDDPRVRRFSEVFAGKTLTFGYGAGADFRASNVGPGSGRGTQFRVEGPRFSGEFQLGLPGEHNVQNSLAAIAAASVFGATAEECRRALAKLQPLPQRSEILTLPSGVTIISDCYNSNPLAMEKMLETLAAWPTARRRIVVAGEMLELGPAAPEFHRQIGRKCAASKVDWLLAVQGDARFFLEGAWGAGLPKGQGRFFRNAEDAAEFCRTLLQPGDVVLVKGSRAVHLEKVAELLQSSGNDAKHTPKTAPTT
ncbi:MAG: UDP-N-acetylmuramoyl-tripeptide--D-alanyl-D-alanine ligase [Terriglobia bacterium]